MCKESLEHSFEYDMALIELMYALKLAAQQMILFRWIFFLWQCRISVGKTAQLNKFSLTQWQRASLNIKLNFNRDLQDDPAFSLTLTSILLGIPSNE